MKQLLALLICLIGAAGQKAFVFSSSVGYYNYRQNANALKVYALLKANGVGDEDIILGFPENVGCCGKNPLQGVVSFYDNDHENLNRNIEVDLKFSAISVGSVVDALRMKYSPWTFNLHRTALGDEPYLVYLAGHGGDYYFKIRERQALVSQHFEHLFQDLTVRHPQSSVLLLIDSCSAITPFENVNQENFIALGSSSLNEKSLSYGYDPLLNQPKSDEFTFYLDQFLKEGPSREDASIKDLWAYLDFAKLKVHSKLAPSSRRNSRRKLSEFMFKQMRIGERRGTLRLPAALRDM